MDIEGSFGLGLDFARILFGLPLFGWVGWGFEFDCGG